MDDPEISYQVEYGIFDPRANGFYFRPGPEFPKASDAEKIARETGGVARVRRMRTQRIFEDGKPAVLIGGQIVIGGEAALWTRASR